MRNIQQNSSWNILLTLNTPIIKRQEISCSVGPWMPLSVSEGKLNNNQFFIGFSEFKPGQGFLDYLFTKDSIIVQKIEVLSAKN